MRNAFLCVRISLRLFTGFGMVQSCLGMCRQYLGMTRLAVLYSFLRMSDGLKQMILGKCRIEMRQSFFGVLRRDFCMAFLTVLYRCIEMNNAFLDMFAVFGCLGRFGVVQGGFGVCHQHVRVTLLAVRNGLFGMADGVDQMTVRSDEVPMFQGWRRLIWHKSQRKTFHSGRDADAGPFLDIKRLEGERIIGAADKNGSAAAHADFDGGLRSGVLAGERSGAQRAGRGQHAPHEIARTVETEIGSYFRQFAHIVLWGRPSASSW